MNQLGPSAGRAFGPLLAGILISIRSVTAACFGLTALYFVTVIVTMRLPHSRPTFVQKGSAIQQIGQGFGHIRKTPVVFWVIFLQAFSLIFFGMAFPVIPAIAVEVLDTSEVQFAWMWGAFAFGQAAAAIVLAIIGGIKRSAISLLAAVLLFSVFFVFLGLTDNYWFALVFLFGMGAALPLWGATLMTLLQHFTSPE